MPARIVRAAIVTLLVLAAASPAAGTEGAPTLGARLSPATLVYERAQSFEVSNRSTVPVLARMEATGGWTLGLTEAALDVGELVTVPVVSAGEGDAVFRVTLTAAEGVTGMDAAALVLETRGRHLTWVETLPSWSIPTGILAALALFALLTLGLIRWGRRVRA